jgi:hypothetical protein
MCDHLSTGSAMMVFVPASQRDQEDHVGEIELCLYLRRRAKSFGILL